MNLHGLALVTVKDKYCSSFRKSLALNLLFKRVPVIFITSNLTSTRVIFKSTYSWMWHSSIFPPLMKMQSGLKLLLVCTNKAVMISVVSFILHRSLHHSISFILRMKGAYFHVIIRFLCLLSWDWLDPESWFTHENLLFLVWLVACDMGCKTMVKLIKWFWWLETATKRLVWLQMSLNVQQIGNCWREVVGLNGNGESKVLTIWEHVGRTTVKFIRLKCIKVNIISDCNEKLIYMSPPLEFSLLISW